MLPWAADDLCHAKFSPDNCTLGKEVSANIVRVCRILLHILDLYFLGDTSLGIADCCKFCTKCTNFTVPPKRTADLPAFNTNVRFSRC